MTNRNVNEEVYGPGTFTDAEETTLPNECHRLLEHMANITPGFLRDGTDLEAVNFHGQDLPIIPGPLKSQAMSAVLNAMIGVVGKDICSIRGFDTGKIDIDVDKAGLYPATPALVSVSGKGLADVQKEGILTKVGKDVDGQILTKNAMHYRSWAIFPTKDPKVWYQLLGNLDPAGFLRAYGLDPEAPVTTRDEAYELIKSVTTKYSAAELDIINMEHGFCGQTCYTPAQWRKTQMAKRLSEHPVIDVKRKREASDLPPVPFPSSQDPRPLAGIKIVELARVIAGPAMGAALASLGADVIKVFSPNLHDLQPLSVSLTAGKRTCALDLTVKEDREKLQSLIDGADVVVQAFRKGSLERKGFGLDAVLEMATRRKKGIVYVDLNCYGPDGYYAERPGFQQIADAASGCSYVVGKSLGLPEGTAVLPPLPVADMLSGAVGVIDILLALRARALEGAREGNWTVSPETVKKIQEKYKFAKMTPDLHVEELLYVLGDAWAKNSDLITRKGYMINFPETAWGVDHSILSPIVKFENDAASPRWDHGPVPYLLHKDTAWS
ncbi:alpha methylacyl racemase [Fusarium heterosporum]|uniref:Alpha methylacyl racemase n=1 Tax=Fusarium heterosporum TaxID=42747 RepID=A0A8H5WNF1_FUSHE|nr:alpha methylacyl racemase [Fusarium heterosporum]